MKFVDRKHEQERLTRLLSGDVPAFAIIRGRRRVGKSTLIKRILKEADVYFEADRTDKETQMSNLSYVLSHTFPGFNDAQYKDWRALLTALNHRVTSKITLCLDEFPYLVESDSSLPSVIQTLLDSEELKYNIILCGSSQTMMYNLTHEQSSPLYGRKEADFNIRPIKLPFLQEALGLTAEETIENYAVWGGIPRYWRLRESSASLMDSVNEHIMSTMGALYEEPQSLFQDDFKDIVKTSTIMTIVGGGANRLKEIAGRCNEPATNLSRPLAKLIDLGYLEKDIPFGVSAKDTKKSLYRIADPFLFFHYKFVPANRSFIELGRTALINGILESRLPELTGYWWERLCRDAVTGNTIKGITYSEARRWWGQVKIDGAFKDVELDIVAESLDGKHILIGECKWTSSENGRLLTNNILKIVDALPFTKGKSVVVVLFTKVKPIDDIGNAILPEEVIKLSY